MQIENDEIDETELPDEKEIIAHLRVDMNDVVAVIVEIDDEEVDELELGIDDIDDVDIIDFDDEVEHDDITEMAHDEAEMIEDETDDELLHILVHELLILEVEVDEDDALGLHDVIDEVEYLLYALNVVHLMLHDELYVQLMIDFVYVHLNLVEHLL